ncbi:5-deoxy-glucuronate isomerase, partial [Tenacibaculum sp.]|uniref:5-deoxy-glucuronate isomerase n=1 Tax=Tenacibaculum sp. TaxID=1906242 RepID=UPI003D123186
MKNYNIRYASNPEGVKNYNTKQLREEFLIQNLFTQDCLKWIYSHYDRFMVSGLIPLEKEVKLESIDPLKSSYFLERREMGIINVGGSGVIKVDGTTYDIDTKEALYLGQGNQNVIFSSKSKDNPAKFYINSTPAHKAYPTKKIGIDDVEVIELGSAETANARTLRKYIVNSVVDVCQ